jgi:hypothetical protein
MQSRRTIEGKLTMHHPKELKRKDSKYKFCLAMLAAAADRQEVALLLLDQTCLCAYGFPWIWSSGAPSMSFLPLTL